MRAPENSRAGAAAYELIVRQRLTRGELARPVATSVRAQSFAEFAAHWMETYVKTNNKPSEQRTKAFALKNHLNPAFGKLPLGAIGAQHVESYKAEKLRQNLCPKSVNNQLAILARCLRTACEWDALPAVPNIKLLKTVSQRLDFLGPDESERLVQECAMPMWTAMALLALRTGMRLGELTGLMWQDVDFERQQLTVQRSIVRGHVGTPKSGKIRHIPMTNDATAALRALPNASTLVFSRPNGTPITQYDAEHALHKLCDRTGIRRISWHILRHSFASHLATNNVPIPVIKDLMGHSSIVMTMRYAHMAPSTLRAAVNSLESGTPAQKFGQQVGNATPEWPPASPVSRPENVNFLAEQTQKIPPKGRDVFGDPGGIRNT